jgi:hypothetical protein
MHQICNSDIQLQNFNRALVASGSESRVRFWDFATSSALEGSKFIEKLPYHMHALGMCFSHDFDAEMASFAPEIQSLQNAISSLPIIIKS